MSCFFSQCPRYCWLRIEVRLLSVLRGFDNGSEPPPQVTTVYDRRRQRQSLRCSSEADFRFWYAGLTPEQRVVAVGEALENCLAPSLVVIPALRDLELARRTGSRHTVNEAVLAGYAPRPPARKNSSQRLRLADSRERSARDVADQTVDPIRNLRLPMLEPAVILGGTSRPARDHLRGLRTKRRASASRMAF